MRQINDPIQPRAEQILVAGLVSLPRPHRSPSHFEGKESQHPIRRNRKINLQETAASFKALEILHGRQYVSIIAMRHEPNQAPSIPNKAPLIFGANVKATECRPRIYAHALLRALPHAYVEGCHTIPLNRLAARRR
jgi:hypothetical protein